jgi:hypothetical protein
LEGRKKRNIEEVRICTHTRREGDTWREGLAGYREQSAATTAACLLRIDFHMNGGPLLEFSFLIEKNMFYLLYTSGNVCVSYWNHFPFLTVRPYLPLFRMSVEACGKNRTSKKKNCLFLFLSYNVDGKRG